MPEPFQRYLIAGDPRWLRPLLDILNTDRETTVHGVTRNDQGDPERLVVTMDPARAEAFQVGLGPQIIIEPDDILDL